MKSITELNDKIQQIVILIVCAASTSSTMGVPLEESSLSYEYDSSGNMTSKTTGFLQESYIFDGSALTKISTSSGVVKRVLYDNSARISDLGSGVRYTYGCSLIPTAVDSSEGGHATVYQNAAGMIVGIESNGAISPVIWDGDRMVCKGSKQYVFEIGSGWGGTPVLSVVPSGMTRAEHCDYIGTSIDEKDINAFGDGMSDGFVTGKPFFKELGAFVFPNRLYFAEAGIWNAPDPSGLRDGHSRYSYLRNPFSQFDRFGLDPNFADYPILVEDESPKANNPSGPHDRDGIGEAGYIDATFPLENYYVMVHPLTFTKGAAVPASGLHMNPGVEKSFQRSFYNEVTISQDFSFGCEYANISDGSSTTTGGSDNVSTTFGPPPAGMEYLACGFPELVDTWRWQKDYCGSTGNARSGARSAWVDKSDDYYSQDILRKVKAKEQ